MKQEMEKHCPPLSGQIQKKTRSPISTPSEVNMYVIGVSIHKQHHHLEFRSKNSDETETREEIREAMTASQIVIGRNPERNLRRLLMKFLNSTVTGSEAMTG